jgi:hypothetical protein
MPDSNLKLKFRAAMRIGGLAGSSLEERQNAFQLAKDFYDARSNVVHGGVPPGDFPKLVEDTRQLARAVLREWC